MDKPIDASVLPMASDDVAAAVEERLAARIIDELEVGAALDHFGEAARGIDMGMNVDHLVNGHRDLLIIN